MTEPRCDNCRFWWDDGGYSGECRRYPPRQELRFDRGQINFVITFPDVAAIEWCGEHQPVIEESGHD